MITSLSSPPQAHTVPKIKDWVPFIDFIQSIKTLNKTSAKKLSNPLFLGNCTFLVTGNYWQYRTGGQLR